MAAAEVPAAAGAGGAAGAAFEPGIKLTERRKISCRVLIEQAQKGKARKPVGAPDFAEVPVRKNLLMAD